MVTDAGNDIEMGLNWGFSGGLKREEEILGERIREEEEEGAERGCLAVTEARRAISIAHGPQPP